MTCLDHIILKVNELDPSVEFYTQIMGFKLVGEDGPFTVIRVSPEFQIQLAPWGTPGMEHYAFSVTRADFDAIFQRVQDAGIEYGESFHSVGTNTGPGIEPGAMGDAPTVYFEDPSKHLIEIRTYE